MSDYLWDPSAEADPEIEELEEALSSIRYRPAISELPEPFERAFEGYRRKRSPQFLAAAAALTFMLLALGLWLASQTNHKRAYSVQVARNNENQGSPDEIAKGEVTASQQGKEVRELKGRARLQKTLRRITRRTPMPKLREIGGRSEYVRGPSRPRPVAVKSSEDDLSASNAAEGEAAKEQIMLALQISSVKVSLAQRLAQGATSRQGKLNP